MNKIIWKDIDSTTIKGLIISELPPITKPKMRVQETKVDGVDGSIIEELGYESYDKTIIIGLSYNYDIDEVIKYFSGEGNVVFSNEPNKYYKARIIDKIDYDRLLRFKTAKVKFRVQPFKYEYQEEQVILSEQEATGTDVKIENSKITKIIVEGNSTQEGTPTPEAPVEIESVGDDVNLLDYTTVENTRDTVVTLIENGFNVKGLYGGKVVVSNLQKNTDYCLQYLIKNIIGTTKAVKVFAGTSQTTTLKVFDGLVGGSFNTEENTEVNIWFYASMGSGESEVNFTNIKFQKGTVATAYSEYGKGTVDIKQTNEDSSIINNYVIPLSQPLRSLPNEVKDTIEEDGIHRRVGSVVLDGSEEWMPYIDTPVDGYVYYTSSITNCKFGFEKSICSHFENYNSAWEVGKIGQYSDHFTLENKYFVSDIATVDEFKTWLSQNPITVDYELAEEVIEPFDEEQQAVMNNLKNTNLEGLNYISADTNIVIDYINNKAIVENTGNYLSSPIIKIEGTGTIELIVNGNKLFRYTFPDGEDTVVIDSQKQDAYLGTDLKNRNMSGEFPIFETGENIITWEGVISNIEISSKSRWL